MYNKIKQDISEPYYLDNYSNDGQRFIAWYLRNIHNLDQDEALECITDGAKDKQIDAIYIDNDNQTVYVIQGKFKQECIDTITLNECTAILDHIKNLETLQYCANDKLKRKVKEMADAKNADYDFVFEFVTTAKLSDDAYTSSLMYQNKFREEDRLNATLDVVDTNSLIIRYEQAINKPRPFVNCDLKLIPGKYMVLDIAETKAIIATVPLSACLNIDGIKDGRLFRKNVRHSLGNNKVNKEIASTIKKAPDHFYFLHNGITALCSKMEIDNDVLHLTDFNVINGCQSLSTIYSCSETVRKASNAYIMFKIYAISNTELSDEISRSTNTQSTVKTRDLRSNEKCILKLKKSFEQYFPDGYMITKRGEKAPQNKNRDLVVDIEELGSFIASWYVQRPTKSYSSAIVFKDYFDVMFRDRDYSPKQIIALTQIFRSIDDYWNNKDEVKTDKDLSRGKSVLRYHHLYALSIVMCCFNNVAFSMVPNPDIVYTLLSNNNLLDEIIDLSYEILTSALKTARDESVDALKDDANSNLMNFFVMNWLKNLDSIRAINKSARAVIAAGKMFKKDFFDVCYRVLYMPNMFINRLPVGGELKDS